MYLSWGFEAHQKTEFEILIGGNSNNWVAAMEGDVPENAFVGGHRQDGDSLFIARKKVGTDLLVGKVHPRYELCYIPEISGNKELEFSEYEVLVV